MRRAIATAALASLMVLAPGGVRAETQATTAQHLEHLMVDNADTPAEHRALARYYRMKAADAKSLAQEHRDMARAYSGKPGEVRNMKQHCEKIAALNDQLATQYEDLAKGEDAAAKQ